MHDQMNYFSYLDGVKHVVPDDADLRFLLLVRESGDVLVSIGDDFHLLEDCGLSALARPQQQELRDLRLLLEVILQLFFYFPDQQRRVYHTVKLQYKRHIGHMIL